MEQNINVDLYNLEMVMKCAAAGQNEPISSPEADSMRAD